MELVTWQGVAIIGIIAFSVVALGLGLLLAYIMRSV